MGMKFGNPKGPVPPKPKGKGGGHAMLPNREALSELTKGDPMQQSMGNYAKLTPSGAGAPQNYSEITSMADAGPQVLP